MPAIRRRPAAADPTPSLPGGNAAWVLPSWWDGATAGPGWTPIGLPDPGTPRWLVDPAGGLTPAGEAWSVEWWLGAEDRWHVPSQEGTARLRLIDGAPIVEMRVHVPGGDVVLTEWAVPAGPGAGRVAVVIRNESTAALAVAAVLRPWGAERRAGLRHVAVIDGRLHAEGSLVIAAQEPAAHAAIPSGPGTDCGLVVLANGSRPSAPLDFADASGWANAALVWPLARQGSLRMEVTSGVDDPAAPSFDPEAAARGWAATIGRGARLELPAGPLTSAVAAQIPRLLLAAGWPGLTTAGRALVADGLASAGFEAEAGAVIAALEPEGRRAPAGEWAPWLWAVRGRPDRAGSGRTVGEAAEAIARGLGRGASPDEEAWALAGLRAATGLLADLSEPDAAAGVMGWIERAGPAHPSALADHLGVGEVGSPAVASDGGPSTIASGGSILLAAAGAARRGTDPSATVAPLLSGAGPTWSGPAEDGTYDPLVAVGWWALARALVVDDRAERLALFPAFLGAWRGQPIEVHGLPTAQGEAAWAVRWHGDRPALLWDIVGEGPIRITAPGLDPSWSATARSGEALLRA